jgi:hypothetical protein
VIGPAIVLATVLALFHVSAYVFIRGRAGARVPVLLVAAFLGAWAGDAAAGRLDADPVRIGDFHVVAASVFAWLAIGVVAILAVMAPTARERTTATEPAGREPATRDGSQPVTPA